MPQQRADTSPGVLSAFQRAFVVELRKIMFTRSTRAVLIAMGILMTVVGTVGIVVVGRAGREVDVSLGGTALGFTVVLLLPVAGSFVMASDWQSRDVMTLFALEARRNVIFVAKIAASLALGVLVLLTTALIAIAGSAVFASVAGLPLVVTRDGTGPATVGVSAAVGLVTGIAYGAALLRPAVAILFAFVQALALDPALATLPANIGGYFQLSSIADLFINRGDPLQALTAVVMWVVVPLSIGQQRNRRREVR